MYHIDSAFTPRFGESKPSAASAHFPVELLDLIFARCDQTTLSACVTVNRHWHAVATSYRWKTLTFATVERMERCLTILTRTTQQRALTRWDAMGRKALACLGLRKDNCDADEDRLASLGFEDPRQEFAEKVVDPDGPRKDLTARKRRKTLTPGTNQRVRVPPAYVMNSYYSSQPYGHYVRVLDFSALHGSKSKVTDGILDRFVRSCPFLEECSVEDCYLLTDASVIRFLKRIGGTLRKFDISGCSGLSSDVVHAVEIYGTQLTHLR